MMEQCDAEISFFEEALLLSEAGVENLFPYLTSEEELQLRSFNSNFLKEIEVNETKADVDQAVTSETNTIMTDTEKDSKDLASTKLLLWQQHLRSERLKTRMEEKSIDAQKNMVEKAVCLTRTGDFDNALAVLDNILSSAMSMLYSTTMQMRLRFNCAVVQPALEAMMECLFCKEDYWGALLAAEKLAAFVSSIIPPEHVDLSKSYQRCLIIKSFSVQQMKINSAPLIRFL